MANYNLTQTGAQVQQLLDTVAAGYIYMGTADLTTTPDTTNPNVCYLLKAVGTYTNFGNIQHTSGIGIALWNGTAWSYQNVPSSAVVYADATPMANSTNPVQSGGVYEMNQNLRDELYGNTEVTSIVITRGGSVTFPAIELTQAGDYLKMVCEPYYGQTSGAYSYSTIGNSNISNGLQLGVGEAQCALKNAANAWVVNPNSSEGGYTRTSGRLSALLELGSSSVTFTVKNASDTILYTKTSTSLSSFRFDCFGNLLFSTYQWSGTIYSFEAKSGNNVYTLSNMRLTNVDPTKATINSTTITGEFEEIEDEIGELTERVENAEGAAKSVDTLQDITFNSFGQLSTPTTNYQWAKVSDLQGKMYTGTGNFLEWLGIHDGSVTYAGVTMTIANGLVTFSGTATATGVISYQLLQGYSTNDAPVAETTMGAIPNLGNWKVFFNKTTSSGNGTLYIRSKSASWVKLLNASTPTYEFDQENYATWGAIVAYIASGTTYSGTFRMSLVPSSLNLSYALFTGVPDMTEISSNGVVKVGEYALLDGSATLEGIVPCTNTAFTKGKTIAWFGDSLSELRQLPHLVEKKMSAKVYDCSFAGSPFTSSGLAKWYDTGVQSLFSQIANDDFSLATAAINQQYTDGDITEARKNAKLANLATLQSLDFSEIDYIVILSGTNDLSVASLTIADFKTKVNSALTTIMTAYPNVRVYCILPPYRTDAYTTHPNGLTLPDINNAIAEKTAEMGIPTLDFLHCCGVNAVNNATYLGDGLHPTATGDAMWSDILAKWLLSI